MHKLICNIVLHNNIVATYLIIHLHKTSNIMYSNIPTVHFQVFALVYCKYFKRKCFSLWLCPIHRNKAQTPLIRYQKIVNATEIRIKWIFGAIEMGWNGKWFSCKIKWKMEWRFKIRVPIKMPVQFNLAGIFQLLFFANFSEIFVLVLLKYWNIPIDLKRLSINMKFTLLKPNLYSQHFPIGVLPAA